LKKIILIILVFLFSDMVNSAPRRVLLELGTSVYCYVCPKAHKLIQDSILPHYPQSVVISIHTHLSSNTHDPYADFHGDIIRQLLKLPEYFNFPSPGIWVDRSTETPEWFSAYDSTAYRYMNFPTTPVTININSKSFNPATRQFGITATVNTEQTLTGMYYLCLAVTENNLIYRQEGAGDNYVHNWILRDMVNDARGEMISSGVWNQSQQITKSYSTTLNSNWIPSNCNYVLYLYKSNYPDTMLYKAEVIQSTTGSITSTGIRNESESIKDYSLMQNYPNPFNPITNIKFSIPKQENVSLRVFDLLGREVENIFGGNLKAGTYNAEFNAKNLSSGIYFYVLKTGSFSEKKKMVLIK